MTSTISTFESILNHTHSGLRWVALILLILAIFYAFTAKKFEKKHKMITLFAMVTLHLQFVIGIVQYLSKVKQFYVSGWITDTWKRFYGMEHFMGMLLAIVLITIGYSKSKRKENDADKFKTIRLFYLIGFILILLFIPWPFRLKLNGGWF